MHPKYWKFPGGRRFMDQANGDEGGSSAGGSAAPTEAEKAAAEKAAADKVAADKAAAEAGKKQPTDEEAKLLKEVMQKKEALKAAETEAANAKARLAEFEGIDAAEVKKLLAEKKTAEEAALAAKGDFDTLKARMAEEHTKVTVSLQDQIKALQEQLSAKDRTVDELSIGVQFGGSKFITDELTLTPTKARTIYGAHFDTIEGQVVAFDKPRGSAGRTALVDQLGNNIGFEDALRKLVDADPDRDSLLRSKVRAGAGSGSSHSREVKTESKPTDSLSKITAGISILGLTPAKSM